MIQSNYQRLGSIVMRAILERLGQPVYQVMYRTLMKEFQSNVPEQLFFQSGRPKISDIFPCVGIEAVSRKDEWGAVSHTKDIKLSYELTVGVKALTGQKELVGSSSNIAGDINQVEHYVIALSELILEILNEPFMLQWTIDKDQDGNPITPSLRIYDSMAEDIQYGFLYNGALRIGKISWFGSVMRLGPGGGGGSGFYNPPAPQ